MFCPITASLFSFSLRLVVPRGMRPYGSDDRWLRWTAGTCVHGQFGLTIPRNHKNDRFYRFRSVCGVAVVLDWCLCGCCAVMWCLGMARCRDAECLVNAPSIAALAAPNIAYLTVVTAYWIVWRLHLSVFWIFGDREDLSFYRPDLCLGVETSTFPQNPSPQYSDQREPVLVPLCMIRVPFTLLLIHTTHTFVCKLLTLPQVSIATKLLPITHCRFAHWSYNPIWRVDDQKRKRTEFMFAAAQVIGGAHSMNEWITFTQSQCHRT